MYNKKTIKVLGFVILVGIIFFVYANVMTFGNQTMPLAQIPKELKELEHDIQAETFDKDASFDDIPKHEFQNCKVKLVIHLYISNDSITKSKEQLNSYILSVSKRVNRKLMNKNCMDSLIVDVSSYYSKAEADKNNLKTKYYRYSFSIK